MGVVKQGVLLKSLFEGSWGLGREVGLLEILTMTSRV